MLVRYQVEYLLTCVKAQFSFALLCYLPVSLRTRTIRNLWDQEFYCPWCCQCHLVVACKYFVMKLCWETMVLLLFSVRDTFYFPSSRYVISIQYNMTYALQNVCTFLWNEFYSLSQNIPHNIYIIHCYRWPNLLLPTYIWQFFFVVVGFFCSIILVLRKSKLVNI